MIGLGKALLIGLAAIILPRLSYAQITLPDLGGRQSGAPIICERGSRNINGKCVPIVVPENAELNYLGTGWTCRRGFRNAGDKCLIIQIPENGELNVAGNGWTCRRGFQIVDARCVAVQIPANGELNVLGNGWTCKQGFQSTNGNCVAVNVPENAQLNVLGNGWICKRGFRNEGGRCATVNIPENAQLDILGNDWTCKSGFKRAGSGCQKMTDAEIAAQQRLMQELIARRQKSVGRGDTYTTGRGAEFSIRVWNADLNCSEGFSGGYDSCEVEVNYEISTNYNGNNSPNVSIRCEAEISRADKSGWSNSESDDESKTVYMYGKSESGSVSIDFNFYEPAARVRLTDVSCKITSVY